MLAKNMISVAENVSNGDRVYAWISPFPMKGSKKPDEREYVAVEYIKGRKLKLSASSGYSIIYEKELLETWYGNVHKA